MAPCPSSKIIYRQFDWFVGFFALMLASCAAPSSPPKLSHSKIVSYRDARNGREGFVVPRTAAPLFDPARSGELLEEKGRDAWQKPSEIVRALHLPRGASVADVGSGSGYLLPYLSRAVGPSGTVWAQEIQPGFAPMLRRRAQKLGNVRVVMGTADDTHLPRARIDCFILLTVYHEVQNPVQWLRALHQAARLHARLAIIDFDGFRKGSPPAPVGHQIADVQVIAEALAAGWHLKERHEFLSSQFFLVFQ